MINRFPVAMVLGYYWALKAKYPKNIAKLLGYAIAVAPCCVRNSWRWGMKISNGVAIGRQGSKEEEELLKAEYISFSRWTFALKGDKITLARLKKLQWWDRDKWNNTLAKLDKRGQKKLLKLAYELLKDKSAEEIERIYTSSYRTWQGWMDLIRKKV